VSGAGPPGEPPWACPVCDRALTRVERRLVCARGHSFDLARQGYVNLLVRGQRRSHQPGDSAEMVAARRRFLATGAYDPLSDALAGVVAGAARAAAERSPGRPATIVDVGCGEGHHTRRVAAALAAGGDDAKGGDGDHGGGDGRTGGRTGGRLSVGPVECRVAGLDVAKLAVGAAASAHPGGWYAVASAGHLPLHTGAVDVALDVFGPVVAHELARVVAPGGVAVAAHPGPGHLGSLRALVYADPRPHEVKGPLRDAGRWFARTGATTVTFPIVICDPPSLADLFAMTPYRWHAPPGIDERLTVEAARPGGFCTNVDVVVTSYRRTCAVSGRLRPGHPTG